MPHLSLQIIHEEHTALAALLKSLTMMVDRGPVDDPESFFDVLRAMLFYIDEFPERLHHTNETKVLPAAQKLLTDDDWAKLDAAFATHCDPLTGKYPRDPMYDRLFTHIVMRAPAPIGLGKS